MKKYKLQDLVANGSHSRLKVDSDLLVGDIKNGYGYGDVLDANATTNVATNIAENKVNAAKLELLRIIEQMEGGSGEIYTQVVLQLEQLQNNDALQDQNDALILQQILSLTQQIQNTVPTVGGDNDNLIFNL